MASLNWQRYDAGMQVNEAMFVRMMGWVEKPGGMRRGGIRGQGEGGQGREKVAVELVGVSSCTFFISFYKSYAEPFSALYHHQPYRQVLHSIHSHNPPPFLWL